MARPDAYKRFVVEESRIAKDGHEFLQLALRNHLPAREARHHDLRIEHRMSAVETAEKSDPCRRDDEHIVGVAKRIAQQEPWLLDNRRGHDIYVTAQSRK